MTMMLRRLRDSVQEPGCVAVVWLIGSQGLQVILTEVDSQGTPQRQMVGDLKGSPVFDEIGFAFRF